ncbi:VOC family protein [Porticoccaceae bacterium]|nr:VOC family protein [Porticoccaceae bacterium]
MAFTISPSRFTILVSLNSRTIQMPMPNTQFDHIVVFVADLNQAITDFTDLGFQVTPGGSHGITENALVIFPNQTYIELLALRPSWYRPLIKLAIKLNIPQRQASLKTNIYSRLTGWICGETGPVDWCVRTSDLNASLALWESQEFEILHSEIFFRERNDGQIARWKLGGSRQADLPFLLEDLTPIDTRVPLTGATGHANGAKDLIGVQFGVSDKIVAGDRLGKSLLAKAQQTDKAECEVRLSNMVVSYGDIESVDSRVGLTIAYSGGHIQQLDTSKTKGIAITMIPTT